MRPDPDFEAYQSAWAAQYDRLNYNGGLSGWVLAHSHRLLERPFGPEQRFETVLEVGAGSGQHLESVRHGFDRYLLTDGSEAFLQRVEVPEPLRSKVEVKQENAVQLTLADDSVDRLIACHVLEHLPEPHRVLREWVRVLKPGGMLSLVLPCDPGLLWRLGRILGPRRSGEQAGIAYDYWMAREHINPITNLTALIDYYFDKPRARWWPMRLPWSDANLIYAVNIEMGDRP